MERISHMDMTKPAIEMREIVKKFGDFTANDHVNLLVHKGEVHAILGENGAGKSTLMNVLYGLYQPTSGQIFVGGKEEVIHSPSRAIELGIGMVHQHFMLVQPFSVTENIILGMEPMKGLTVDLKTARKRVEEISKRYNMQVDPDAKIEDISVGMQQRVEILKVLYRGADILILDEPTASLTPQEITELMEIISNLTADGKSVILITHKLKEITSCADYCTIIRQGKYIDTVKVSDVNENDLAAMMVGRKVEFKVEKKDIKPGEVVLEVKDIHGKDYRGVEILKGLNLSVRRGEIVGLAGVDGNGQTELVEILTGLKKGDSGEVLINGKNVFNKKPKEIFESGITSIPADRQKHGLVLEFSVAENLILQNYMKEPYSKKGVLKKDAIMAHAKDLVERFDIRPAGSESRPAGTLSGGNQQKAILGRWLSEEMKVILLDEPTRGIDVGAKHEIYNVIYALAAQGVAVLFASSDLPEVLGVADRIVVMREGEIAGELLHEQADERQALSLAMPKVSQAVA